MKWPWQKQKPEPMTKQQLVSLFLELSQACAASPPCTKRICELSAKFDAIPTEFVKKHASYIYKKIGKQIQADSELIERVKRNRLALQARLDQGSAG